MFTANLLKETCIDLIDLCMFAMQDVNCSYFASFMLIVM